MNGFEYSLQEIDEALTELVPDISRRACTARVMAEVDELLDQRNELVYLIGAEVVFDSVFGGGR